MKKSWIKSYSKYTPETVDLNEFDSIIDLFEKSCYEYANNPAYVNMGVSLSYKDLNEKSKAFASFIQNELNMKKRR